MIEQKMQARFVKEGDFLPGLDNGYVFEDPERNRGWLSYPRPAGGYSSAMPEDTIVIGYHDADGDECYLLLPALSYLTVKGEEREMDEEAEYEEDDDY
jgi:hypothetical protein